MLELKLHTILVVAHLVGLALGAGAALTADIFILRNGLTTRIEQRVVDTAEFLGGIVALGLALLWISGLALMAEALLTKPQFYANEKFWAKLVIVTILTVNGVIIHNIVLPKLKSQMGRGLFDDTPAAERAVLCSAGAISGVSWMLPILLGSAKEWSNVASFADVMTLYFTLIAAVAATASFFAIRFLTAALPDRQPAEPPAGWQEGLARQVAMLRAVHEIAAIPVGHTFNDRRGRIVPTGRHAPGSGGPTASAGLRTPSATARGARIIASADARRSKRFANSF